MSKIPTFQELCIANGWNSSDQLEIEEMAKISNEHTKLHVEAALKAAVNNLENKNATLTLTKGQKRIFVRENILSAYPLTNIK